MRLQLDVQTVRTDNGIEFKNKVMHTFFAKLGITQTFSAARTPEQNGVVERKNRTLVEAARSMLATYDLPQSLWAKVVSMACHTQNRSIIHRHFNKTPYKLINDKKANGKYFRVFCCRCFILVQTEDRRKVDNKA